MNAAARHARRRGARRGRRGAVAVEMALITPVLAAMIFGILEFGWLLTVQHTLVNAAREGARLGVLQGTEPEEIEQRVLEYLAPMGLDSVVTVDVTEATLDDPTVLVVVTAPRDEVSLVGSFFGFTGGQLEGRCAMRKEGM